MGCFYDAVISIFVADVSEKWPTVADAAGQGLPSLSHNPLSCSLPVTYTAARDWWIQTGQSDVQVGQNEVCDFRTSQMN